MLDDNEGIIAAAMAWISENLPDRYCAGEPRFDVRSLSWRVPVLLSYPSGKSGEAGEIMLDFRTHELVRHTPLELIRARGGEIAKDLINEREWRQMRGLTILCQA